MSSPPAATSAVAYQPRREQAEPYAPAPWRVPLSRLATDAVTVAAALTVLSVATGRGPSGWHLTFAVCAVAIMGARGAYSRRLEDSITVVVARHVVVSTVLAMLITVAARAVLANEATSARSLLVLCAVTSVMLAVARVGGAFRDKRRHAAGIGVSRAILIGADELATRAAKRLRQRPQIGLLPIGYLDDGRRPAAALDSAGPVGVPMLGRTSDLAAVAHRHRIDAVVITDDHGPHSERRLCDVVATAHELRLTVFVVPRLHAAVNTRTRRHRLGTVSIDQLRPVDPRSRAFQAKYAIDRIIGLLAVVALAPLLLTIAIAVKLSSPGPVLYRQRRVGLDGREFDILKYRSMRVAPETPATWTPGSGMAPGGVEGDDRRTPIGKFLRSSNLDELPQLLNIAKGEMCLVGPRPERPEFVARFREELTAYDTRHRVKAGLTGWAQVHGLRGKTSIAERVEWDNYYIENWSFALDLAIIVRTVKTFFQQAE